MKTLSRNPLRNSIPAIPFLTIIAILPHPAFGHPGHGLLTFYAALIHPITGLDHLLTALAVGVWAAGPKEIQARNPSWRGPLGFLIGILGGALAGQVGMVLPFCEQGILLSLLLLGLCLALNSRSNIWPATGMLFCFGAFHGNAHGLEVAQGASGGLAILGFLVSTGILHGMGIAGVTAVRKRFKEQQALLILRWAGVGLMGSVFFL